MRTDTSAEHSQPGPVPTMPAPEYTAAWPSRPTCTKPPVSTPVLTVKPAVVPRWVASMDMPVLATVTLPTVMLPPEAPPPWAFRRVNWAAEMAPVTVMLPPEPLWPEAFRLMPLVERWEFRAWLIVPLTVMLPAPEPTADSCT